MRSAPYLLADVAHVAGLIAAGVYPNPVGIADVVSFTTHKTLNGPRGAVLITHRRDLSRKLDRAVFPGEQGGPHINAMAGLGGRAAHCKWRAVSAAAKAHTGKRRRAGRAG